MGGEGKGSDSSVRVADESAHPRGARSPRRWLARGIRGRRRSTGLRSTQAAFRAPHIALEDSCAAPVVHATQPRRDGPLSRLVILVLAICAAALLAPALLAAPAVAEEVHLTSGEINEALWTGVLNAQLSSYPEPPTASTEAAVAQLAGRDLRKEELKQNEWDLFASIQLLWLKNGPNEKRSTTERSEYPTLENEVKGVLGQEEEALLPASGTIGGDIEDVQAIRTAIEDKGNGSATAQAMLAATKEEASLVLEAVDASSFGQFNPNADRGPALSAYPAPIYAALYARLAHDPTARATFENIDPGITLPPVDASTSQLLGDLNDPETEALVNALESPNPPTEAEVQKEAARAASGVFGASEKVITAITAIRHYVLKKQKLDAALKAAQDNLKVRQAVLKNYVDDAVLYTASSEDRAAIKLAYANIKDQPEAFTALKEAGKLGSASTKTDEALALAAVESVAVNEAAKGAEDAAKVAAESSLGLVDPALLVVAGGELLNMVFELAFGGGSNQAVLEQLHQIEEMIEQLGKQITADFEGVNNHLNELALAIQEDTTLLTILGTNVGILASNLAELGQKVNALQANAFEIAATQREEGLVAALDANIGYSVRSPHHDLMPVNQFEQTAGLFESWSTFDPFDPISELPTRAWASQPSEVYEQLKSAASTTALDFNLGYLFNNVDASNGAWLDQESGFTVETTQALAGSPSPATKSTLTKPQVAGGIVYTITVENTGSPRQGPRPLKLDAQIQANCQVTSGPGYGPHTTPTELELKVGEAKAYTCEGTPTQAGLFVNRPQVKATVLDTQLQGLPTLTVNSNAVAAEIDCGGAVTPYTACNAGATGTTAGAAPCPSEKLTTHPPNPAVWADGTDALVQLAFENPGYATGPLLTDFTRAEDVANCLPNELAKLSKPGPYYEPLQSAGVKIDTGSSVFNHALVNYLEQGSRFLASAQNTENTVLATKDPGKADPNGFCSNCALGSVDSSGKHTQRFIELWRNPQDPATPSAEQEPSNDLTPLQTITTGSGLYEGGGRNATLGKINPCGSGETWIRQDLNTESQVVPVAPEITYLGKTIQDKLKASYPYGNPIADPLPKEFANAWHLGLGFMTACYAASFGYFDSENRFAFTTNDYFGPVMQLKYWWHSNTTGATTEVLSLELHTLGGWILWVNNEKAFCNFTSDEAFARYWRPESADAFSNYCLYQWTFGPGGVPDPYPFAQYALKYYFEADFAIGLLEREEEAQGASEHQWGTAAAFTALSERQYTKECKEVLGPKVFGKTAESPYYNLGFGTGTELCVKLPSTEPVSQVESQVEAALGELRHEVLGAIAPPDEPLFSAAGADIKKTAEELDGARSLVDDYVQLGMPSSVHRDPKLNSFIFGPTACTGGIAEPTCASAELVGNTPGSYELWEALNGDQATQEQLDAEVKSGKLPALETANKEVSKTDVVRQGNWPYPYPYFTGCDTDAAATAACSYRLGLASLEARSLLELNRNIGGGTCTPAEACEALERFITAAGEAQAAIRAVAEGAVDPIATAGMIEKRLTGRAEQFAEEIKTDLGQTPPKQQIADGDQIFARTQARARLTAFALAKAEPPVITTEPSSERVIENDAATFTVAASGEPLTTIQWERSTDGGRTWSADITDKGGTTDTLTIEHTVVGENGYRYRAKATNDNGVVESVSVLLEVTELSAPQIVIIPTDPTVAEPEAATFHALASGVPTPAAQWEVSTDGGQTWQADTVDAGNNTDTLTIEHTIASESGNLYRVTFSNSVGATTSSSELLLVIPSKAPQIATQPVSVQALPGAVVTFTATSTGSPAPTVQWERSIDGGKTWYADTTDPGSESETLTIATVAAANTGYQYRARFHNRVGTETTPAATLMVDVPPRVLTEPVDATVVQGNDATFTATATGSPTPTVQWEVSSNAGATWNPDTSDPGNQTPTLTLKGVAATAAGEEFRARFDNPAGSQVTGAATLTVLAPPKVTSGPAEVTVTEGETATFSAVASGTPQPSVHWEVSSDGGKTFAPDTTDTGSTTGSLKIGHAALAQRGYEYRARFENSAGTETTAAATLIVLRTPAAEFTIASEQEVKGSHAGFTTGELTVALGQTLEYRVSVRNTGTVPLALSGFTDVNCVNIAGGPSGAELAAEKGTTYTCERSVSHSGTYTDEAFVEATPPILVGFTQRQKSNRVIAVGPSPSPTIESSGAATVGQTTAVLNAMINSHGGKVTACQFEYGTGAQTVKAPCAPMPGKGTSAVSVSAAIKGLTPHTSYHFKVSAASASGGEAGGEGTFQTMPSAAPAAETLAASDVGQRTAVVRGGVNPDGGEVTSCTFEYGTTALSGSVPCIKLPGSGTSTVAVSAELKGLAPSTSYHYRVTARSAAGKASGATASIHTTLQAPPSAEAKIPSEITAGSALLSASVNPNGAEVTACKFEYGTSSLNLTAPCAQLPGAGLIAVTVSARVTGLVANTTYHYRVTATSLSGSTKSGEAAFKT